MKMPGGLNEGEKRHWKLLTRQILAAGTTSDCDESALSECVAICADIDRLRLFVREQGESYETAGRDGVQIHLRPEASMLARLQNLKQSYLIQFGLTPVARSRAKIKQKQTVVGVESRKRG